MSVSFEQIFFGLLALSPIVLIIVLVYGRGMSSRAAIPVGCGVAALLAWLVWQVDFFQVLASTLKGLQVGLEMILTLIIAIVLGRSLRETRMFETIRGVFDQIHPDRRIQAILIAWFFGSALESILGFSATGSLTCLLMAGIGFPPACGVVMAVMGLVPASAFAAASMPIEWGVRNSLQDPEILAQLHMSGLSLNDYLFQVAAKASFLHGIVGFLQPLLMTMTMMKFFAPGPKRSWFSGLDIAPFALFCGLALMVPYVLTAAFVGYQFPPLVSGVVGLAVAVTAIKIGFLIPKKPWRFAPEPEWRSDWKPKTFSPHKPVPMPEWKVWFPLLFLAFCMVMSRFTPVAEFLKSLGIREPHLFGTMVSFVFHPLFLPVAMHLVVIFVLIALYPSVRDVYHASTTALFTPIASIFRKVPFAIATASIYAHSSVNHSGRPGMLQSITDLAASLPASEFWCTFLSPFMAAIAVFSPESCMFSNAELSALQYHLGESLGLSGTLFVALQIAGSSTGTMLAFNYIAGSGAYVGLLARGEAASFRRMLIPAILYLSLLGAAGIGFAHFWDWPAFLR